MIPDRPSYISSMTSQLMLAATIAQLSLGFWLMKRGNTEAAIALIGGAFTTIKGMYDQRKAVDSVKNGQPGEPRPGSLQPLP